MIKFMLSSEEFISPLLFGFGEKKSIFSQFRSFMFVFKAIKWILILVVVALLLNAISKAIKAGKKVIYSVKSSPSTEEPVKRIEEPRQGQEPRQVERVRDSSNWD